jgi:phosphoglycolate phosphatase-like HAD superfamily hydrolase
MSAYWASAGAEDVAKRADLLVLDIDGVLLDPRPSFYEAARRTSSWAAEEILGRSPGPAVTDDEVAAFKAVGGWNDDFDLACGMTWGLVVRESLEGRPSVASTAAKVGGGLPVLERFLREVLGEERFAAGSARCPTAVIRARSAAHYSGLERCREMYGLEPAEHEGVPQRGLWSTEPVLCDAAALRGVPIALGFFTGRNAAEAHIAVERLELTVAQELRSIDDGVSPRKPQPDGLLRLAQGRSRPLVFVGDSIDDQRAALAYRKLAAGRGGPEIVFARVVPLEEAERAKADGADFVISSLDELITRVWKEGK